MFETSRHAYIMNGKRVDAMTEASKGKEDRMYFDNDKDSAKDHGWVPKDNNGIVKDGLDDDDEDGD